MGWQAGNHKKVKTKVRGDGQSNNQYPPTTQQPAYFNSQPLNISKLIKLLLLAPGLGNHVRKRFSNSNEYSKLTIYSFYSIPKAEQSQR